MTGSRTAAHNDIGRRIGAQRRAQQLTLVELAGRTGVSRNALLEMEHGRNTTINTVVAAAAGLGFGIAIELVLPARPEPHLSLEEIERMVQNLRETVEKQRDYSPD